MNPNQTPDAQRAESVRPNVAHHKSFVAALTATILCLLAAVFLRITSGGWSTLTLFIPNSIALLIHCFVVSIVLYRTPSNARCVLVVIGGIAFLCAIAFQTDYGDGSGSWFVFQWLIYDGLGDNGRIPSWWPLRGHDFRDLFLIVPCAAIWLILIAGLGTKPAHQKRGRTNG